MFLEIFSDIKVNHLLSVAEERLPINLSNLKLDFSWNTLLKINIKIKNRKQIRSKILTVIE